MSYVLQLLIAWSVIFIVTSILGVCFRQMRQPPVMGEVIGGILLGPSFFGAAFPLLQHQIFPAAILPDLKLFAEIGMIIFMFLIGLELDVKKLADSGRNTLWITCGSILFPFALGLLMAPTLFQLFAGPNANLINFTVFFAVALSVTAFPVLTRILADFKITQTKMGTIVLTCAASGDAIAWCLLAAVIGLTKGSVVAVSSTFLWMIFYVFAMFFVIKPLLPKMLEKIPSPLLRGILLFAGLFASATITERIGVHEIFGAFIFGIIVSGAKLFSEQFYHHLKMIVQWSALPIFFALSGLRLNIGLVTTASDWYWCALIVAIAIIGKFGGAMIPARLTGLNWRESTVLGILMNTRGLVELIVLNLGLDYKIISPSLFTMLVVMTLVTTLMTSPLFSLFAHSAPERVGFIAKWAANRAILSAYFKRFSLFQK